MSADFWAGYISGAVGILIGNPLDLIKVRLQAERASTAPIQSSVSPPSATHTSTTALRGYFPTLTSLITGTAAPILGYGALNAVLFVSYNRSEAFLNSFFHYPTPPHSPAASTTGSNLYTTFLAGCVGGLTTWAVSAPTELIKCRAQVQTTPEPPLSSFAIARQVLRAEGVRGLYFGGTVTAVRDSVGYGFYFWSYELSRRWMGRYGGNETADVLLCGGLAGIVTWASIFPLDVIKTRVQTQVLIAETAPLLGGDGLEVKTKRLGAWQVAKEAYREGGPRVFFRGLGICSVRAFIVNAVQWAAYEWIMTELGQGRDRSNAGGQLPIEVI